MNLNSSFIRHWNRKFYRPRSHYKRCKVSPEQLFLNVDPVQWLTSVSWREVLLLHFCIELKWMLKYDICSHKGIGVNIVYLVGPNFSKRISSMIFANQFKVSNVSIVNIESKSSSALLHSKSKYWTLDCEETSNRHKAYTSFGTDWVV